MSNALAIATVTTALAQLIRSAAQGIVAGADVLTSRPDPSATPDHRIHLFLYQVIPNLALSNADLPTRSGDYRLVQRPVAALNLHYLLAFYGSENDLEPQRMLGAVTRDLHASPVLTRPMIQSAVSSLGVLNNSNLAEAVETVKIVPQALSLEDFTKIWSVFFQVPYALSVAYQAAVVLIEADDTPRPALPVLQRGREDRGVSTQLGPFPTLERIHIGAPEDAALRAEPPSYPSARLGTVLNLHGQALSGDMVKVNLACPGLPIKVLTIPSENRSANHVQVFLPAIGDAAAQAEYAAGIAQVSVVVQNGTTSRTSNVLPLPFAAQVTAIQPPNPIARDVNGDASITVTCSPQLRAGQQVRLLLEGNETPAESFANGASQVTFIVHDAPSVSGSLVRVRVDGVDSQPFERVSPPPRLVFADSQKVTIT